VIASPVVRAVTLTGSEHAGMAVAAIAGQHLKKCVLELGGSDPFIVLADADLHLAAQQAALARCQNSGQSCIAAKRFIVEAAIAEEFTTRFVEQMKQLVVGDPTDPATDVGPLARADLRDSLHDLVERSREQGARLLTGGAPRPGPGYYYPPTVLDQVTPEMPVFAEETFGPVAAIVHARDVDHALELANQSAYGLGASIWSANAERAASLAPRIDAGCVFINAMVKSDPRLPFGGIKRSGYGRELADYGLREFVNIKTVWVN
jgi:succinate-semialdehyde dehydrogenase/glutarate-semialdehyde dehydrogenase